MKRSLLLLIFLWPSISLGQSHEDSYKDNVLEDNIVEEIEKEEKIQEDNYQGLYKYLSIDLTLAKSEKHNQENLEKSLNFNSIFDTQNWGSFSINGAISKSDNHNDNNINNIITIHQRDFYLNESIKMDNSFGANNTFTLPLSQNQQRFGLPSAPFFGLSSQIRNKNNIIQYSTGRNGFYSGSYSPGFEIQDGNISSLGFQHNNDKSSIGGQYISSSGLLVPSKEGGYEFEKNPSQALYLAYKSNFNDFDYQINFLSSKIFDKSSNGAWFDIHSTKGRFQHYYGAFYLDNGLTFGSLPINNNVKGVYYRTNYHYGPLSASFNIDKISSINDYFDSIYSQSSVRYQKSTKTGIGGSLSILKSFNTHLSSSFFIDNRNDFGLSRAQIDLSKSNDIKAQQISLNHSFPQKAGSQISTQMSVAKVENHNNQTISKSLALYGRKDLTSNLSLNGQIRYTTDEGPESLKGLNANLGLTWQASKNIFLSTTFYKSIGSKKSQFILDPLSDPGGFVSLPKNESLFLTISYKLSKGRKAYVVGAPPGSPSGSISGTIFFDKNKDNIQNADELGIPDLTIAIDKKYVIRTDKNGYYKLENLSTGDHLLTISEDNLPLPWIIEDNNIEQNFEISIRKNTILNIPAIML